LAGIKSGGKIHGLVVGIRGLVKNFALMACPSIRRKLQPFDFDHHINQPFVACFLPEQVDVFILQKTFKKIFQFALEHFN
jgi:hypothetical protein